MIFIFYIIIVRSVDSENLASVVHKSLFYKLSSIFLLCVGEFEFYIKDISLFEVLVIEI